MIFPSILLCRNNNFGSQQIIHAVILYIPPSTITTTTNNTDMKLDTAVFIPFVSILKIITCIGVYYRCRHYQRVIRRKVCQLICFSSSSFSCHQYYHELIRLAVNLLVLVLILVVALTILSRLSAWLSLLLLMLLMVELSMTVCVVTNSCYCCLHKPNSVNQR